MTKKKMSGLKLSAFSGIQTQAEQPETEEALSSVETQQSPPQIVEPQSHQKALEPETVASPLPDTPTVMSPTQQPTSLTTKEKPVTINIKISRQQHKWLMDTARTVRDNNLEPVPPGDRVYPQHLIGVAIELLATTDIDWSQVQNVEDLKQQLNI